MKLIVDIKVKNLERAIKFYNEILGFPINRVEKDWASILVGDAQLHLCLFTGVSYGVEFYVDNIDKKVEELKEKGVVFFYNKNMENFISVDKNCITNFPWGRNAFFKDSEDNQLALVKDFN